MLFSAPTAKQLFDGVAELPHRSALDGDPPALAKFHPQGTAVLGGQLRGVNAQPDVLKLRGNVGEGLVRVGLLGADGEVVVDVPSHGGLAAVLDHHAREPVLDHKQVRDAGTMHGGAERHLAKVKRPREAHVEDDEAGSRRLAAGRPATPRASRWRRSIGGSRK